MRVFPNVDIDFGSGLLLLLAWSMLNMVQPERILVVDDQMVSLDLMEAMLAPLGYRVALAQSGEDALRMVAESPPDVILLDVMMPGLNGLEVARRLKADERTRIIPIVMVTALKESDDWVGAWEAGADDFISKPVDRLELAARVAECNGGGCRGAIITDQSHSL